MATRVGDVEVLVTPELNKAALAKINAQILGSLQKNLAHAFERTGQEVGSMFSSGVGRGMRKGAKEVETGAKKIEGHLKSLNKTFRSAGFEGYLMGQALTRAFTLPIGAAVGLGNAFGIHVAAKLESAQVALKALLPPGYDVEKLLKRLQKLAVESPVFNTQQVTQFTRQLVGAGVEGNRAADIVQALGKVYLAYGLSAEDAEKATRGVYQAFSKGRLYSEELNQQISENIPATYLFAKAAQRLGLMTDYMGAGQEKAALATQKLALKQRELAIYQEKVAKSGKPMTAAQKLHIDQLKVQISQLQKAADKAKKAAGGANTLTGAFQAMVTEGEITKENLDDIIIEVGKLPEIARGSAAATSTMSFAFDRLKDSFQNAFANAFLKFSPQIQSGLNSLTSNAQEFADAIVSTTPAIVGFFNSVITKLTNLVRAYNDLTPKQKSFVQQMLLLLAAAGPLAFVLGRVFTVLGGMVNFMGLGVKAGAYLVQTYRALTVWGYAAAGGSTALSRAILVVWESLLAPLGLIGAIIAIVIALIGVLVILYFKWKPFHDLVNATAKIIKDAAIVAFHGLMTAIRAVGAAAVWFYQNALLPTWHIMVAVGRFIAGVAIAVFNALKTAFFAVAGAVAVVLSHLRPFFIVFQYGFLIVAKIFEIAFRLIQVGLYWLGRLFTWLWDHVIHPWIQQVVYAFAEFAHRVYGWAQWIGNKLLIAWNYIYKVFIGPWVGIFKKYVIPAVKTFAREVADRFDEIKHVAKATWDFVYKIFIGPWKKIFGEDIPKVTRGFIKALVDNFDKIGEGLLAAVRYTVKIINGFIRVINKIPGIKKIGELPLPGAPAKGKGGVGPQTKADRIRGAAKGTPPKGAPPGWMWVGEQGPELMYFQGGEHVIPNRASKAMARGKGYAGGTPDWLDLLIKPTKIFDGLKSVYKRMTTTAFGGTISALAKTAGSGLVNMMKNFFSAGAGVFKGGSSVSAAGLQGAILSLLQVLRKVFGNVPLISGLRPGATTLSGNTSYHASGRAIDIPPVRAWAIFLNKVYGTRLKELISPWNDLNILNGRPHFYTGDVYDQHAGLGRFKGNAHIHAALDNGGWVPSGLPFINNTGRPELMLSDAQSRALEDRIRGDGTYVVEVYLDGQLIDTKIATRIEQNDKDLLHWMKRR